jgi:hypothetical protein
MTAATAGAGATGVRAWLATRHFAWLTPRRLRRATMMLLAGAVLAAGTLGGSSAPVPQAPHHATAAAAR